MPGQIGLLLQAPYNVRSQASYSAFIKVHHSQGLFMPPSTNMPDLTGKTVIVTGASKGIGAEAARAFAEAGAAVLLLARSFEPIEAIAGEIVAAGGRALAIACDIADPQQVESACATCITALGKPDILINNAGIIDPVSPLAASDPEAWSKAIDINAKGPYYGTRAVLPGMIEQGGGTIITISSGAAHGPMEGWSHYCSSKAAAAMLTRCIDRETRGAGIRAMGLSPGTVATEMQVIIKKSGINPVSKLDPSVHKPAEWVARALVWMCGDDADEFIGEEVKLNDETIQRRIGLVD